MSRARPSPGGHHSVLGTDADIADRIWFEGEAADGFTVMPPDFSGGLDDGGVRQRLFSTTVDIEKPPEPRSEGHTAA